MESKQLFKMYDEAISLISEDGFLSLSDLAMKVKIKKTELFDMIEKGKLKFYHDDMVIRYNGNYYFNLKQYNSLLTQIEDLGLIKVNIAFDDFKYTAKQIAEEARILPQTVGILIKILNLNSEYVHYITKNMLTNNGTLYGTKIYTSEVLNKIKEHTDMEHPKLLAYERSINKYIDAYGQHFFLTNILGFDFREANELIQESKNYDIETYKLYRGNE